jgi:hypothetical protein
MDGRVNRVEKYEAPTLRIIDSVAELTQAQREERLGGSDRFFLLPAPEPTRRSYPLDTQKPRRCGALRPVMDHH